MRLEHKTGTGILSEYLCELTTELDELTKLNNGIEFHYIVLDDYAIKKKCLPVRVYGGTAGGIWFDDNNVITKIVIDINFVVNIYPSNVNDIVQKYVGQKLDWKTER